MRRAACGSVQLELRLLPYLYAHSISFLLHAYDAIRSLVSTYETTYEETNGHGRDSHKCTVLRAQQSTDIVYTFKTTNARLSDDGTFTMPQRRRCSVR